MDTSTRGHNQSGNVSAVPRNLLYFLIVLGVSCLCEWELTLLFSPVLPLNAFAAGADAYVLYAAMMIASLATTLALWKLADSALARRNLLISLGVILIIPSMLASAACHFGANISLPILILCWVALGAGQVLHITAWMVVFSLVDSKKIGQLNAIGNVIATVIFVVLIGISNPYLYLLSAIVVIASSFVTMKLLFGSLPQADRLKTYEQDPKVSYMGLSSSLMQSIVFGFVLMLLFSFGFTASVIGAFSGILGGLLAYLWNKTKSGRILSSIAVQYVTLPVIVIGLLLIPFSDEMGKIACCCLISVAHSYYRISTGGNLAAANISHGLQPIRQSSFGTLPVYGGMIVGIVLGFAVFHTGSLSDRQIDFVISLIIMVIICGVSIYGLIELRRGNKLMAHFSIEEPAVREEAGPTTPHQADLHEVARRFGLSSRETEIFLMLARGRNSEHIRTQLSLAPGTVKTHIYHIYQKMGVNSHQQLIDLAEGTRSVKER